MPTNAVGPYPRQKSILPTPVVHISQEAVQLHGGMGMTEELKVSHTFRRLTMIAQTFGDADHHLERFATCG